jgi:hypothetical protein
MRKLPLPKSRGNGVTYYGKQSSWNATGATISLGIGSRPITDIVESTPMTKLEMSGMKARGDDFANVEPVLAGYR